MHKQNKIRVAVLYGGLSCEHEISLVSARNIIEHLNSSLFEVIPIKIDKKAFVLHELFKQPFDVVFPVLHGPFGEDGSIQGFLELINLPYVGCGVLASAIGMDKEVAKRLVAHAGIPVLPFIVIKRVDWDSSAESYISLITKQLSYPLFVKPVNMGSSVGVKKLNNSHELPSAIHDAFQYDVKIIIEKGIDAIEIEVALLESEQDSGNPIVSIAGEIKTSSKHAFYSYASKYLDEYGAELSIPATVSSELQEKARTMAKNIFSVLNCEGMARVDLFIDRKTNNIYFNEINTIPGFTQTSMYPKLMVASGWDYSELLTSLIRLAINRHARKNQLKREYK